MLCEAPVTDGVLQSTTYHVDLHRNTASDLLHTMQSGMVWRLVSSGGELLSCGGVVGLGKSSCLGCTSL